MHRFGRITIGVAVGLTLAAAAPSAAQEAPDNSTFWRVLNDSTLDRLLGQALRGSPDLRAADARLEGAAATRLHAALDLAPAITASGGYVHQRQANAALPGGVPGSLPDQGMWSSAVHASWEVDVTGRLRGRLRAQNALIGSADEEVKDARIAITGAVTRAYFQLRGAQQQLAVARRNAANQQRTLELTMTRLDAGRGSAFDTERARAQLGTTRAAIPLLEARVSALRNQLAVLTGRAPQELGDIGEEGSLPELPDSVPEASSAHVIGTRPDVAAAERRVEATRALVGSARSDYLPRLSLAASAGYLAGDVGNFGRSGTFNYTVGPVLSWPLFDIGRVKARVDLAQAQEVEARAQHERAVLEAQAELETADVAYRTARARLAFLREAAVASERAAELARLRYEGGIADFLQVLDAERTLLAAQDQLAQSETDAAAAYVALFEARGGKW